MIKQVKNFIILSILKNIYKTRIDKYFSCQSVKTVNSILLTVLTDFFLPVLLHTVLSLFTPQYNIQAYKHKVKIFHITKHARYYPKIQNRTRRCFMLHTVITGASCSNHDITRHTSTTHNEHCKTDMRKQTHLITECEAVRTGNDPKDCFLYEEATCKNRCRFLKFGEYCDYI